MPVAVTPPAVQGFAPAQSGPAGAGSFRGVQQARCGKPPCRVLIVPGWAAGPCQVVRAALRESPAAAGLWREGRGRGLREDALVPRECRLFRESAPMAAQKYKISNEEYVEKESLIFAQIPELVECAEEYFAALRPRAAGQA